MIKKSTQSKLTYPEKTEEREPSRQTIDFLKLFARSYNLSQLKATKYGKVCLN
ncbi:hypothetical protein M2132_002413 [Dysgonomonas sp. PH5-45]|uniref:hypothetical protein n=1 Tax=unclassified Dysgonomonas TaxID=2630389 RepID=UPI002477060D|nr:MULTISPECIES: hypothetical protein [unclassified Dysgonomonas]MDH6356055.1 hypothetical protein [Dysgonomonas sp. PH5-45]MDH6388949.1 hypothetical protein [Dysgonomonas sp. PH5-37]